MRDFDPRARYAVPESTASRIRKTENSLPRGQPWQGSAGGVNAGALRPRSIPLAFIPPPTSEAKWWGGSTSEAKVGMGEVTTNIALDHPHPGLRYAHSRCEASAF